MSDDDADFLRNLGLFPGYDPAQIPGEQQQAQIAGDRCGEWLGFVAKNRKTPQQIVNLLDEISTFIIAAVNTKGDHREEVIRLGLSLRSDYWLARGMWDRWRDTLMPVLKIALSLPNYELVAEAYRQWGIFLYLSASHDGSQVALGMAIDYAEQLDDPNLILMARAERFNLDVLRLSRSEAEAQAAAIFADARRHNNVFVMGRVRLTLTRAYAHQNLHTETFMTAQQSFLYFIKAQNPEFALQALNQMLTALSYQYHDTYSPHYKQRLLRLYQTLGDHSVSPIFQAHFYHHQGLSCFQKKDYQQAKSYITRARIKYSSVHQPLNCAIEIHMLGLIESKRENWMRADLLFTAALKRYEKVGTRAHQVQARYARAYLAFEKKDFAAAVTQLKAVLPCAEKIEEQAVRERIITNIQADIDAACRDV